MPNQTLNKAVEFERVIVTLTGQPVTGLAAPVKEVEAYAGKGTGLAYHQIYDEAGESDDDFMEVGQYGYIVTQVRSGKRLGYGWVDTPRQAKRWIELLVKLADWNKDLGALVKGPGRAARLKELAAQVEQARQEAIDQCLFIENF